MKSYKAQKKVQRNPQFTQTNLTQMMYFRPDAREVPEHQEHLTKTKKIPTANH